MLVCYLDDSGNSADPIQTLAGLVAPADAWSEFEVVCLRAFEAIGLPFLHTVDLYHRRGAFANWSRDETANFANSLFEIVEKYSGFAIEASVQKSAFLKEKGAAGLKREGSPIGMCFRVLVTRLLSDPGFISAEEMGGVDLSFVIESGHKNNNEIYDRFLAMKRMDPSRFGTMRFEAKKRFVALQAADFIAFFTRRIRTANPQHPRSDDTEFFMRALGGMKFIPFIATGFDR